MPLNKPGMLSLQQRPKGQPFEVAERNALRQKLLNAGMKANDVAFLLNHTDTRGKAIDILVDKLRQY